MAFRPRTRASILIRPEIYSEKRWAQPNARSTGRKLIVCIDGTSNQYSEKVSGFLGLEKVSNYGFTSKQNTNVIELYSHIEKSSNQLTYYNSGIGTYAKPSWRSLSHWKQVIYNLVDLAIAW